MCGIFGFYSSNSSPYEEIQLAVETLFRSSSSRGKEASGVAVMHSNDFKKRLTVSYTKSDQDSLKLLKSDGYKRLVKRVQGDQIQSFIGHSRMTTHGSQLIEKNNQPVFSSNNKLYCIHNGIVTNYKDIWAKYLRKKQGSQLCPDLDTQVLLDYLEQILDTSSLEKSFNQVYQRIEGVVNLATVLPSRQTLVLSSNTGSLYWMKDSKNNIHFASEKIFLAELNQKLYSLGNVPKIIRVQPNSAFIFSPTGIVEVSLDIKPSVEKLTNNEGNYRIEYKNYQSDKVIKKSSTFFNDLDKLRQHTIDEQRIDKIKRCAKCILPATTPFITFNSQGICNYCLEHSPITVKGDQSLEEILSQYRKNNGEPDCLIAFSGGRDSSYGLHLLKEKWGMNPLAYTYDWGMISDLGRRNQARMLGKLKVEQILISADISQKRKHVRENILAWIKNPHLGMVPLFMEGDKQCEFYADQTMKKYDIKLMIYCRGNELEKEEFKAGHCGVRDADPQGVIHNLAVKNKLKLLQFFGWQYLKNPAYLNSSLIDTAFAYFSTYIQHHNYLYLWHYLPWEEKEINKVLPELYNWETSPDTTTTWRIGDGTPAFYNYIYYQVQGFTENDSLRARQVREGIIKRETALDLVKKENKVQYNNLKWYFDTIELDGDMVLSVVDKMKKLY